MKQNFHFGNYFAQRELTSLKKHADVGYMLEDSFIAGHLTQKDLPLSSRVSSTIAIAMAADGKTFATTHGDHTVKVFHASSHKLYREFVGHPRTPWTVKYHSADSNIVGSGCLGGQVSIASSLCFCLFNYFIRYGYGISREMNANTYCCWKVLLYRFPSILQIAF
jgi:hypothetical protein